VKTSFGLKRFWCVKGMRLNLIPYWKEGKMVYVVKHAWTCNSNKANSFDVNMGSKVIN